MADSDSDDNVETLQYKVIVLGDGAVGKTSLIMRFCEDSFQQSYKQTIGLDFFIKRIVLPGNVHVTLQLWDIGGQQLGGRMLANYIYGSHGVILVYDVTNMESFKNLEDWYDLVKTTFKDKERMPYVAMIGNKMDLNHLRVVKSEKHSLFAVENGMSGFFCVGEDRRQGEPDVREGGRGPGGHAAHEGGARGQRQRRPGPDRQPPQQ